MATPLHILSERLGDERILLDLNLQEYLSLNASATLIWEGHSNGLGPSQIARSLHDAFEVSLEQALSDVGDFLLLLKKEGLSVDPS